MAAQLLRGDADGDAVGGGEALRGHADPGDVVTVLRLVGGEFVGDGGRVVDSRRAGEDDDVAAAAVAVEVEGDSRGAGDVAQLGGVGAAVDQDVAIEMEEPDWFGVRGAVFAGGGEPADRLAGEAGGGAGAERARSINLHGRLLLE